MPPDLCLVRALFLIYEELSSCCIPTCWKGRSSFSRLFLWKPYPTHEGEILMIWSPPKASPPNIIIVGMNWGFNIWTWEGQIQLIDPDKGTWEGSRGDAFLYIVVRRNLFEKGTFEQKFEKVKEWATRLVGEKTFQQMGEYVQRT